MTGQRTFPFELNRRMASFLVIGIIITAALLSTVPFDRRHGHLHEKHTFRRPRHHHHHNSSGPAPEEFLRPHMEQSAPLLPSFVNRINRGRYDTLGVWRGDRIIPESDKPDVEHPNFRPFQPPVTSYADSGEYLKQTLVADYPSPRSEKLFLMLKTGATVMWERLPIHLFTTLTRVKNFALYSDLASSIGGYEVIDILKDMPADVLGHRQLGMYRTLRDLHEQGLGGETSGLNLTNQGWDLDKFKNIPMLVHAYETSPDSEWFVFMDDDSYFLWGNVEAALAELDYRKPYYLGSNAIFNFKINGEMVPYFAHGGSGVIISKGAMDKVFGPKAKRSHRDLIDYYSELTLEHCCGDMIVAYMFFQEAGIKLSLGDSRWPWKRMGGEPPSAIRWHKNMWCEPLLSFHHTTPRDIEHLWEYERLSYRGGLITHADLYHDWLQPFIVEERPNWRIDEFDINGHEQFGPEDVVEQAHDTYSPAESAATCKRACGDYDRCMSWYHFDGFCGLHMELFRPGVPCTKLHKEWPGSTPTTGWMVNRIRRWRAEASCDGLTDDNEFSEGWYLRALQAEADNDRSAPSDSPENSPGPDSS